MKRLFAFLKTPLGSVVLLVAFIIVGAILFGGKGGSSVSTSSVSATPAPMERHTITRDGQLFKVPTPLPLPTPPQPQPTPPQPAQAPQRDDDAEPAPRTRAARRDENTGKQRPPAALPISLLTVNIGGNGSSNVGGNGGGNRGEGSSNDGYGSSGGGGSGNGPSPPSARYAPFGRLIPCETIITLESSKLDTPIIGLVTEDVWHEGRLIIPAGAEVHGRAAVDRARERIAASGQWLIVWRDRTTMNGVELTVRGIALDRERNDTTGEFGLRDGSAGLVGQVLKNDDWQEIKLFASTFLSGAAAGLQELRDTTTATGDITQVPKATARNAALAGASNVLNTYAAQVAKMIAQDGFYVRVPAGKQFYLYVTQTLDQAKATRANARARLWQPTGDNADDDPANTGTRANSGSE